MDDENRGTPTLGNSHMSFQGVILGCSHFGDLDGDLTYLITKHGLPTVVSSATFPTMLCDDDLTTILT